MMDEHCMGNCNCCGKRWLHNFVMIFCSLACVSLFSHLFGWCNEMLNFRWFDFWTFPKNCNFHLCFFGRSLIFASFFSVFCFRSFTARSTVEQVMVVSAFVKNFSLRRRNPLAYRYVLVQSMTWELHTFLVRIWIHFVAKLLTALSTTMPLTSYRILKRTPVFIQCHFHFILFLSHAGAIDGASMQVSTAYIPKWWRSPWIYRIYWKTIECNIWKLWPIANESYVWHR